jgi:transposase
LSEQDNNDEISIALAPLSMEQIKSLKKEDLALLLFHEQKLRLQLQSLYSEAQKINVELQEKKLLLESRFVLLKNKFFGKSSERSPHPKPEAPPEPKQKKKKKKKQKKQKPSERYPNLPLIERDLQLETPPNCGLCQAQMTDSGMVESCEFLTVIPANFAVIEQNRHKYRCPKCHGDIQTTPAPPRIYTGSAYSDEFILDVALSKYCDLIPIERYVNIAARKGVVGLPPQSLIETTHHLAEFLKPVYDRIRAEILSSRVLHADETPHRMLEGGGEKSSWYLWGFSNSTSSYFEIHNTRSGDVVSGLLSQAACERLVSDVFSGYGRAVRIANEQRIKDGKCLILNCYCNAHARRKFKEVGNPFEAESEKFVALYKKIYRLEKIAKKRPLHRILRVRRLMKPLFEQMKGLAESLENTISSKSTLATAANYFLNNYTELTYFLSERDIPIDNNQEERELRSPVIGRKTWYGTHSIRGAETNVILFTLVSSCKLCKVNPRTYFRKIVSDIHEGKSPPTPSEFHLQAQPSSQVTLSTG